MSEAYTGTGTGATAQISSIIQPNATDQRSELLPNASRESPPANEVMLNTTEEESQLNIDNKLPSQRSKESPPNT